jgi:phosphomannomutase/phosphoglucomutase
MPEAIEPNTENEYIAVTFTVPETDKVVLLGVDFSIFADTLPNQRLVPGYYEFWQNFANKDRAITSIGDEKLKQGEPLVANLNSTQWRIAFWPKDTAKFNSELELMLFFGGLLVIMTFVGIGGFIGISKLQNMVRTDASNFVKWLLDFNSNSQPMTNADANLKVFQDMSKTIAREKQNLGFGNNNAEEKIQQIIENEQSRETLISALGSNKTGGLEVRSVQQTSSGIIIPDSIFREYDIRGVVGDTLTADIVREIGRAIGSEAFDQGEQRVAVARDGRLSGPELMEALTEGLVESGRDVIDIGEVPTPLLYFATNYLDANTGVMLTGSHNPKDYNGLKIVIAGRTLSGEDIQGLRKRIETGNMVEGQGSQKSVSVTSDYISQVTNDIALANPLKVAIDCGNGIAGNTAPQLFQALGCEVVGLYCDVDGNFPNHHPDPSKPENLEELIELSKTEKADVGLAFDGDGDRLGVIDSEGNIIWPDRQLMLYAIDVLSRNPGAEIIYDVKCTKHLAKVISEHGGVPVMWKTGHSLIKAKMRETGALLAGECSGHVFFKERWYGFDDALYTAARLLEIISADPRKSVEIFKALPESVTTPEINIKISDERKFDFIQQLSSQGVFGEGKIIDIDGVRVEYQDGWGLVRASNTTPNLVMRFEGNDMSTIERIKKIFKQQMLMVDNSLDLDF